MKIHIIHIHLFRQVDKTKLQIDRDKKINELETKAMTTSSHCNTGRMCVTLPIITRENTSLAIHVVQKITIIRLQKIGKFAV